MEVRIGACWWLRAGRFPPSGGVEEAFHAPSDGKAYTVQHLRQLTDRGCIRIGNTPIWADANALAVDSSIRKKTRRRSPISSSPTNSCFAVDVMSGLQGLQHRRDSSQQEDVQSLRYRKNRQRVLVYKFDVRFQLSMSSREANGIWAILWWTPAVRCLCPPVKICDDHILHLFFEL